MMKPLHHMWQLLVYAKAYLNEGWLEQLPEEQLAQALKAAQGAKPADANYSFVAQFTQDEVQLLEQQEPEEQEKSRQTTHLPTSLGFSRWHELEQHVHELGFLKLEPYRQQPRVMVVLSYSGADYAAAKEYAYKWLASIDIASQGVHISVVSRKKLMKDELVESSVEEQTVVLTEVALVRPKMLLLCGRLAVEAVLGVKQSLSLSRLASYDYQGIKALVTYDPQVVLSFPLLRKQVWQDIRQLKKMIMEKKEA